ncbi:MAG: universal stress protein [Trueperaceae bacterium]|nr:universal stress protein [Trueperaceae bacterium]
MAEVRILVPLDGSEFSQRALDVLGRLFSADRDRVTLLRVGTAPGSVGGPPPRRTVTSELMLDEPEEPVRVYDSQEWDSARGELRDALGPAARRLESEGWRVERATAFGDPAEEIEAICRDEGIDVVVMATHGRTGLSRALLGSVAERVLRRLEVPVTMVRPSEVRTGETQASETHA